jgi:TonB family protein
MHETNERARTTSLRLPRSWRPRVVVVAVIVICYGALFYGIAHVRAPRSSNTSSPPMFAPIISNVSGPPRVFISSKRWEPDAREPLTELLTPPPRHWTFPPIDLWPSAPDWSAALSGFTPVTDARPDSPETQSPLQNGQPAAKPPSRRSNLQMVRWLRPVYSIECTSRGVEGSVVLDLLIDPAGQPVEITVAQSSGSPELDRAVLHAANLWRFAPPSWRSRPVEVWGRVELRFNC